MREVLIERKLITAAKSVAASVLRVCPACDGMPDRIVLLRYENRLCGGKGSRRTAKTITVGKAPCASKIRFPGVCPG